MTHKIKKLQVILKTMERCNIACDYCYYFFSGDESYKKRPPSISLAVIDELVEFLRQGIIENDIDEIQIVFHGGEPLLQKKNDFDYMCTELNKLNFNKSKVNLSIQTNATLISEEWISLFAKHDVSVGVSIDGRKEENDLHRIDKSGRGTYEKSKAGIDLLINSYRDGRLKQTPWLLTVVNKDFNYEEIIQHFHEDLGFTNVGVLLPDFCHDNFSNEHSSSLPFGDKLIETFNYTISNYDSLRVRQVSNIVEFFQQGFSFKNDGKIYNQIIVVQSDGEISLDDSYMPANEWRLSFEKYHLNKTSLSAYLARDVFKLISDCYKNTPKKCQSCNFKKICNGGDLENRYKTGQGFSQESIYCDGLKKYYQHVIDFLVANGYPMDLIQEKLEYSV